MADDNPSWVWLRNPTTGGVAQFPPQAAGMWRGRGWVDSSPPPEPDVLKDPAIVEAGANAPDPVTADPGANAPAPQESTTTTPATGRGKTKETQP